MLLCSRMTHSWMFWTRSCSTRKRAPEWITIGRGAGTSGGPEAQPTDMINRGTMNHFRSNRRELVSPNGLIIVIVPLI